jgi:hypothetical protein
MHFHFQEVERLRAENRKLVDELTTLRKGSKGKDAHTQVDTDEEESDFVRNFQILGS